MSSRRTWAIAGLFCLLSVQSFAQENEREWVEHIAVELGLDPEEVCDVTLSDGSFCDLILPVSKRWPTGFAIEADWAHTKWKEAPGQATLYSVLTDKPPAVLLLLTGKKNESLHLLRCLLVCQRLKIRVFLYDTRSKSWGTLKP